MESSPCHWPVGSRLLLVSDRSETIDSVRRALDTRHFVVRRVNTVDEMVSSVRHWQPVLAVVDLDIANGRPMDRLGTTVRRGDRVPIVALTRRRDLPTKLAAFAQGADDIVTIPFFPEEFAARILALLRRSYRTTAPISTSLHLGDLELDLLNRRVRVGDREVQLTPLDQSLLYLLVANAGQVVTRDEILDHLWGTDFVAESNVVDRHIRNLRRKLHDCWQRPRYIATVPGRGYRFVATAAGQAQTVSPN